MKNKWYIFSVVLFFCCLLVPNAALGGDKPNRSGFVRFFSKIGNWFDGNLRNSIDTMYVAIPDRPWYVALKYKSSGVSHDFNDAHYPLVVDYTDMLGNKIQVVKAHHSRLRLYTDPTYALGAGFGYRSLNVNFYKTISNRPRYSFSIASFGNKFGGEFSFISSKSMHGLMRIDNFDGRGNNEVFNLEEEGIGDIGFSRYYANVYYVISHKKFSYNAGMRSALIQKHSAGSFIVSAMYHRSAIDFKESLPYTLTTFRVNGQIVNNILGFGVGYAHNFVIPSWRHLMFHISVMPMLTISVKNDFKGEHLVSDEEIAENPANNFIGQIYSLQEKYIAQHGIGFALNSHFTITCPITEKFMLKLNTSLIWVDSGHQSGYQNTTMSMEYNFEFGYRF